MDITQLCAEIYDAAYEVRLNLAPGYLEAVYKNALLYELRSRGLKVESEVNIIVKYKNQIIGEYRADIIVENKVIIELKAVRDLNSTHEAQLVNYLVATGIDYGYLINYGGEHYAIRLKTRIYQKPKKNK